jgi:hypothetical protein
MLGCLCTETRAEINDCVIIGRTLHFQDCVFLRFCEQKIHEDEQDGASIRSRNLIDSSFLGPDFLKYVAYGNVGTLKFKHLDPAAFGGSQIKQTKLDLFQNGLLSYIKQKYVFRRVVFLIY